MPKPGLHQLSQSGATNGQAVVWDNATGLWKPANTVTGITQGPGITVDNTDPLHPIISVINAGEYPMISIDENGIPGLIFDEGGHIYLTEDT